MPLPRPEIEPADPQGGEALALLQQAAAEVRTLYGGADAGSAAGNWPTNAPTPPRGAYFLARVDGVAVGMGAHRPLDAVTSEVRRIFVLPAWRRRGIAQALLAAIESHARAEGFTRLRLETGPRQEAALSLYAALGYRRIAKFGPYVDDPTSICFEKHIGIGRDTM